MLFLASLLLAGNTVVVIKSGVVVPPSADLLSETFNNVTNYDDASWTATATGSGTPTNDPNETATCASGTGFSSECHQTTMSAANGKAYIMNDLGAAQAGTVFVVFYFELETMTAWTGTNSHIFCGGTTTSAAIPSASSPFVCQLEWDADGVEGGESACASGANLPACWRMRIRVGAGTSRAPEVTEDVIHQIKFKVDNGSAVGEGWFDGVQLLTGDQTSADVQFIWLGIMEFSPAAENIVYDNMKVSTAGYVE